jgi:hypothetical protein
MSTKKIRIRLYEVLAAYPLLCGSESRAPTAHQRKGNEAAEMHVLRSAAGHRLRDKKRNEDIRKELQLIIRN